MKQILATLTLAALLLFPVVVPTQAGAVEILSNCGSGSANGTPDVCTDANNQGGNNGSNNPIIEIIKGAIKVISYVIGVAAIIGILASSIRFITAGSSEGAASARSGLVYSLVGLAVAALAQVIVVFVLKKV